MPNPVKRHSRTRRNQRRAHDFLASPPVSRCPQCGSPKLPHRACAQCGYYKGREVIAVEKGE
ncbi:MAG TPA: 50S ribosomal protein L32 [Syntrophales bacterium]|nr:50S ribosomal protein L32 [Syntrophales bacterium]HOL58732.1 50S ribosomal protein L32 [Syntrophales bacterium]HPO34980.1 50S ribosomal protein L32 [Syntrophales bacterium]